MYGLNIINLAPTKEPYYNSLYRDDFINHVWRWDRRIWLRWRNWFTMAWYSMAWTGMVTDVQEIDGKVYYLVRDGDIIRLYVICESITHSQWCTTKINTDFWYSLCCNDTKIELENYRMLWQWKTPECNADRFIRINAPRDSVVKYAWAEVFNEVTGWAIISYIVASWLYWMVSVGDIIQIEWPEASPLVWQGRIITRVEDGKIYVSDPWIGFDPIIDAPTGDEVVMQQEIAYVSIYREFLDTLAFATGSWIMYIDKINTCDPTRTQTDIVSTYGNTGFGTMDDKLFTTSSIFNRGSQVWYISNGYVNLWMVWLNGWYFTPLTSVDIPSEYDYAMEISWALILFSPNAIWGVVRTTTNTITNLPNAEYVWRLTGSFWYHNKGCIVEHLGEINMITNQKMLYSVGINTSGTDVLWTSRLGITVTNMGTYIQEELDKINFGEWDTVSLYRDNDNLKIFISNPYTNVPNVYWWAPTDGSWTKILIFNSVKKFWHQRIIRWLTITSEYQWVYYGRWIYLNYGMYDWIENNHIKQVLGAIVDAWTTTTKRVTLAKYTVWDETINRANNTVLKYVANLWWFEYEENMSTQHNTDYIRLLNSAKVTWEDNVVYENVLSSIYQYHNIGTAKTANQAQDIEAFSQYEPIIVTYKDECTWHAEESDWIVEWYNGERTGKMRVGRYWTLSRALQAEWEQITVAMIADNWDRLHTNWFVFYYAVPVQVEMTHLWNQLVYQNNDNLLLIY